MCVPMYIAEVAPQDIRGILVTINNCAITFGQFVASLVAGAFSEHSEGWRSDYPISFLKCLMNVIRLLYHRLS